MLFCLLAFTLGTSAFASSEESDEKVCACKCVVRETDDSLSTRRGSGEDREAAGEALKKNLRGLKCELSPVCKGSC